MPLTRVELEGKFLIPLLFVAMILYGALDLWLWLVPLRTVFGMSAASIATTAVLVLLTVVTTFCPGVYFVGLRAMDGRTRYTQPPRSATMYCLRTALALMFQFAVAPILVNLVGAAILALVVALG